jgi:hypothetical protein
MRPLPWKYPALCAAGTLFAACSDSSNDHAADATTEASPSMEAGAVQDSGPPDGAGPDGGSPDSTLPDDGGGDAPSTEAGEAGVATSLLQAGANLIVGGITSDGWVVYYDPTSQAYYARSVDGGPVSTLYTVAPSLYGGYVTVFGKVVFGYAWNGQFVGPLWTWMAGQSQATTLTSNGLGYIYQTEWASSDARYIAYLQYTSSDLTIGALYGANADGTNQTLLVSNIDVDPTFSGALPGCFPRVVFRGDVAVASYCTAADAGLTPVIQSFSAPNSWAASVVVSNWIDSYMYNPTDRREFVFPFAVDPDGSSVVAAAPLDDAGTLQVFGVDGGAGVPIGPLSGGRSFAGSPSIPFSIVYNDDAGALYQAYASAPNPQALADGGVNYFNSMSHDGRWMVVSGQRNSRGWFSDLSLVSTQTPGLMQPMGSIGVFDGGPLTPNPQQIGGDGFTTNDKHALMFTDLRRSNGNAWIGNVRSMSVTAPYTTKLLSTGYATNAVPVRGSGVLLLDNFQDTDGGAGSNPTVDLDLVDVDSDAPPVKIATILAGRGVYAVSADRSIVAYFNGQGAAPGIYVSKLP